MFVEKNPGATAFPEHFRKELEGIVGSEVSLRFKPDFPRRMADGKLNGIKSEGGVDRLVLMYYLGKAIAQESFELPVIESIYAKRSAEGSQGSYEGIYLKAYKG